MRLRQARLDSAGVGHGAQLADIGAGDEAGGLGGAQHQAFRRIGLKLREHVIEFGQHLLGQRVGAGGGLVEASQAMPFSSRASFQWRHAPSLPRLRGSGERTKLEVARRQDVQTFPIALHRLDQHGAALPAADAFGGDALLDAEPPHRVHQMEHDAVAARPDRMAEADGAAIDVELVARDGPGRAVEAERLAAEGVVPPGGETGQDLRGECLVEFPQPDIAQRQRVPAQNARSSTAPGQAP